MTQVSAGSSSSLAEAVENAAVARVQPGKKTLQDEIRAMGPQLAMAIPKGTLEPERFLRTVLTEVRKTQALLNCTRESFLGAMMQVAQLGLEVGNQLGQVYLIPYRNNRTGVTECQLQIGYKGYIELAYRGGIIMESREVYENDEFSFDFASEPPFHHTWKLGRDRGELIGFYGTARLPDGRTKFHVMSLEDIEARRRRAQAKDSGPWKTDYTAMCRKTVIRAMVPQTPLSTEMSTLLSEALRVDDATISRTQGGDLRVTYNEASEQSLPAIDAGEPTDVSRDVKRDSLIDAMNAIEPNAARLDCSRRIFKHFGPPENMTEEQFDQAISIADRWPESQGELTSGQPDEPVRTEPIEAEAVDAPQAGAADPAGEGTALDGLLDSIPQEWAAELEGALNDVFGEGVDGDLAEVVEWAEGWVRAREGGSAPEAPEGALFAPQAEPSDNTALRGENVPQDLLDDTKRKVSFWDLERINEQLGLFGLPKTGNLESKKARLTVALAELRHLGDPSVADLF